MALTRRSMPLLAVLVLATPAAAELPAGRVTAALPGLEKYADGLREKTGVPGLAIAVVHADKVVYLEGFGVREVGRPDAIDADTVFQLASVSKPLTATVIAGLVGDKTVTWDSKASDLEPAFRLWGDYVSGEVTLRDLLCHRTGLPEHAGDLLEDLGYSRAEVLRRLRFQKPAGAFRSSYFYTNFGFTEAAVATAKAAGKGWEDLAAERLAHEKPGQTLQATALVHEAYLRLVDVDRPQLWNSRGHFFAAAVLFCLVAGLSLSEAAGVTNLRSCCFSGGP